MRKRNGRLVRGRGRDNLSGTPVSTFLEFWLFAERTQVLNDEFSGEDGCTEKANTQKAVQNYEGELSI